MLAQKLVSDFFVLFKVPFCCRWLQGKHLNCAFKISESFQSVPSVITLLEINILGIDLFDALKLLTVLFSAVLFIQSGFDKVFDWAGNKSYINGLFEKTILKPFLPLLLPVVTALELAAGLGSLAGALFMLMGNGETLAATGLLLGAVSILTLFTGLRIAKEYAGAAAITTYFLFFAFALLLFAM